MDTQTDKTELYGNEAKTFSATPLSQSTPEQWSFAGAARRLRARFMQSPNFITTVRGWRFNNNGESELNNPTITGYTPTDITVANEATDTTCFPLFVTAATGDLAPKTNANLAFNSNTGVLTLGADPLIPDEAYGVGWNGVLEPPTKNAVYDKIEGLSSVYQPLDSDLTTWAGITPGTGVGTALAVNVGSAGAFITFNGALGTPSSGTVTNLTGTASININGTVGATTPTTATFTTATINTSVLPDADDGAVLGASGTGFSDLFLASGAVINSAAGTATLTFGSTIASNVDVTVPDEAYGSGWNASLEVPTKNAVYDKIETMGGTATVTSWLGKPVAGEAATTIATLTVNVNTTMILGLIYLPFQITVNSVTLEAVSVGASGTLDITVYSEDGQTQKIAVTTASISGAGNVTTAVSSVVLSPGLYYVGVNPNSTADITVRSYSISNNVLFHTVTGEPMYAGSETITAGTPDATITPTALTATASNFLALRLDN